MAFFQDPPSLGNTFGGDVVLREFLRSHLPPEVLAEIEPSCSEMGALAAGPLFDLLREDPSSRPILTSWDPWGRRIDRIEPTRLWKETLRIAAEKGLVALPYERRHGAFSRIHQFALVYLFEPSAAVTSCPLAMTDGAAKTLLLSGNTPLAERAVPRLTSRDPARAWTSGQWMTERTGGSDVGLTRTVARPDGGAWRLFGDKWFTSAASSEMALTLARPEGNPPGGAGLALFYIETRNEAGDPNGILVHRLKEKLGTRMLPTAELTLDGTLAVPVKGLSDGVKNIATMLNITRTWNAVVAVSGMRRALDLARDYAKRRVAFGAPLSEKPLHLETLADLEALFSGAFLLAFRTAELLGREEAGSLREGEEELLRILTPVAKLTTAKQAVLVASEALETFGGAGYVEDTGLPSLLRDAQVLPIWEGTTNVLSLDLLRALTKTRGLSAIEGERSRCLAGAEGPLVNPARRAEEAIRHAVEWRTRALDARALEAGARRFALTLGHALELALLVEEAARTPAGHPLRSSAVRFSRFPLDVIRDDAPLEEARAILSPSGGAFSP
ncbi:MAG: acyl-CoA dehydrogenase family protein [Thermoanaerobaculia bacterium]